MNQSLVTLVGLRIRHLREHRKLSLQKLSELAELSEKHLGEIERGRGNPSVKVLEKIAMQLGTDVQSFFEVANLRQRDILLAELHTMLEKASDTDLRKIYTVIHGMQ